MGFLNNESLTFTSAQQLTLNRPTYPVMDAMTVRKGTTQAGRLPSALPGVEIRFSSHPQPYSNGCRHYSSAPALTSAMGAHKMIGPFSGTFSAPYTSIWLKKEHIAELANDTSGLCVNPNGMALMET